MQNELGLRSKTKRSWDYSASSVIRHFDNLNAKILQATPTFTKATRVVATVISCKMAFSNCQSNAEFHKCIHSWREAGYLQAHGRSYTGCYGSRWSTTVAKLERKCPTWAWEKDQCAVEARWALYRPATVRNPYFVTKPMLILFYPDCFLKLASS